jgi:hypothetical protein
LWGGREGANEGSVTETNRDKQRRKPDSVYVIS